MIIKRTYLTDDKIAYVDAYITDECVKDAMLIIPGGGYCGVSHFLEGEPIAVAFLQRGFNCFVLNYHVGKEYHYPTQLIDASLAMLHIKDNHEEYRIDPNRVFAVGFSAGGHLLASLSTMVDNEEIREAFGKDTARLRPTAAVLSYPVTTALEDAHKGSFENLLGKPYDEILLEELRRQSPELSVNEKTPPMFIWHTAEDSCVPVLGSIKMAKALALGGVPYKLSIYPYGPHALGNALNPPYQYPWIDEACQWINTIV